MRKIVFTLMILVPFMGLFAQQNYEPGVILLQVRQPEVVRFSNGHVINSSPQLQAVFQQYPATGSRKLSHVNAETDGCYRIEFSADFPLATIRAALSKSPDIRVVTFNYYGILAGIPNDPLWTDQWALQKIEMPDAWDITKPNSTILVGVMDTGLDYTHEDLADNIWTNPNEIAGNGVDDDGNGYIDDVRGWDFVDPDNDPQEDALTHGTRVAGVISARTYNGKGVAGIAGGWQSQAGVRLIGLRIANNSEIWTQERAKEAIDYLTWLRQNYGYTVIANMSFQTDGMTNEPMPFFAASVDAAKLAGVIMVAAAGNTIANPHSPYFQPGVETLPIPARYDGVLTIGASQDGATLQDEVRSSYSLYDNDRALLVVAPVDNTPTLNVVTTIPNDQYFFTFNGTSAACPIAVGTVSLILSINPDLTWINIQNILKDTADKIGPYTYTSGRTPQVGFGRLNAYEALKYTLENHGGTLQGEVLLSEDLTIQSGNTLTIAPGTTIKLAPNAGLILNGTLNVNGTSAAPVTFTRSGTSGTWHGIVFNSGSSGTLAYATIDHATKGVLVSGTDNVTVDNCTIQNFTEQGVYADSSSLVVQNSTVQNPAGASHGIYLLQGGNPTIKDNTIDGIAIGIERKDSLGLASISGNTIKNCTNGIKSNLSSPEIFNSYLQNNIYAVRLASGSSPDIHDNDIYSNSIGVFLEQSQPAAIKWNNFGWSAGQFQEHDDEGILVNYLQSGNTFLDNRWNNFYDGRVVKDISNPSGVTLDATGNYWYAITVTGPADVSSPQATANPDAGPGGALGKIGRQANNDEGRTSSDISLSFGLEQNFPNPFNPSTVISFRLPEAATVSVVIYDMLGRRVRVLLPERFFEAGVHQVSWNGSDDSGKTLASGVYLYRMQAKSGRSGTVFSDARKLVFMQ